MDSQTGDDSYVNTRVERPLALVEPPPREPALRVLWPGHRLDQIQLQLRPSLTAHVLLQAVAAGKSGLPPALRRALMDALGPGGRAAYLATTGSEGDFCPSVAVPQVGDVAGWVDTAVQQISAADPDAVGRELNLVFGDRLPYRVRGVAASPQRWLAELAGGMKRAGPVVDEVWRRLRPRLDVEQARMEVAQRSAEATRAFLNGLSPRYSLTATEFRMTWTDEIFIAFSGDLVIAPLVVGQPSVLLIDSGPDLYAGYPLTGNHRLWTNERMTGRLNQLLGRPRASVLKALTRSRTMGDLAAEVNLPISTLSHHVSRLAASGLVHTVRLGQHVWVSRSEEGDRLLDLLSD